MDEIIFGWLYFGRNGRNGLTVSTVSWTQTFTPWSSLLLVLGLAWTSIVDYVDSNWNRDTERLYRRLLQLRFSHPPTVAQATGESCINGASTAAWSGHADPFENPLREISDLFFTLNRPLGGAVSEINCLQPYFSEYFSATKSHWPDGGPEVHVACRSKTFQVSFVFFQKW